MANTVTRINQPFDITALFELQLPDEFFLHTNNLIFHPVGDFQVPDLQFKFLGLDKFFLVECIF